MQCWGFSICCFIWLRELSITTGKGVLVQNSFVRVGYLLCLPGPGLFWWWSLWWWCGQAIPGFQIKFLVVMGVESYGKRASAGGTDWALEIWLKPGMTTPNSTPRPLQLKYLFVGYLLVQGVYVQGCPAPALGQLPGSLWVSPEQICVSESDQMPLHLCCHYGPAGVVFLAEKDQALMPWAPELWFRTVALSREMFCSLKSLRFEVMPTKPTFNDAFVFKHLLRRALSLLLLKPWVNPKWKRGY